jgi:hypothetical protein
VLAGRWISDGVAPHNPWLQPLIVMACHGKRTVAVNVTGTGDSVGAASAGQARGISAEQGVREIALRQGLIEEDEV